MEFPTVLLLNVWPHLQVKKVGIVFHAPFYTAPQSVYICCRSGRLENILIRDYRLNQVANPGV